MPGRPPIGARAMTGTERNARTRARVRAETERYRIALERIANEAAAIREAREIAAAALRTERTLTTP